MSDSTSIDSLPGPPSGSSNNIKMQVSEEQPVAQTHQPTPTQTALNNDPGSSSAVAIAPAQVDPNSMNKVMQGLQQAHMKGMTGLTSRDIPMPTTQFTQDQQIKPNYIPDPSNKDYIEEEETYETIIEKKKQKMEQEDRLDMLYNELQMPILIMSLFLLFQLPFTQKKLFHFFPSMFYKDGNMSMGGYVLKTAIFGLSFYFIMKLSKYASEL